jgi:CHAT domain-containing protein
MAAFTVACLSRAHWVAGALLAVLLHGCSASKAPPLPILAERCLDVSQARPLALRVVTPRGGMLWIGVRQRGISLTAKLSNGSASAATLSPVDRYGGMTFLAAYREGRPYTLRILSRDSPDITGQACVSTALIDSSDQVRLAAERAFADGGGATDTRHWQVAFDDYLAAARGFDHVDGARSAEARQAMALLAYRRLDRSRDSYVLAQRALADFGPGADPGTRSALVQLQATIVTESKRGEPDTRRERALQLLDDARALAERARFGARELARVTLLRGFLDYATDKPTAAAGFFTQAAAQCQALRDWECYARARMNGALMAEETSNNAVALQGYADALQTLSPAVAPGLTADIWDNLGRLQGYMGLFSLGEQSQLNAIQLYARIDNCDGVRRALSTLGSIVVHVGNVDDALVYLKLASIHECSALLAQTKEKAPAQFRALTPPAAAADFAAREPAGAACANLPAPNTLSVDGEIALFRVLLAINFGATLEGDDGVAQRCLAAAAPYAATARQELRLANAMGNAYVRNAQAAQARASFQHALEVADRAGLPANHQNREVAYLGLAQAAALAHRHEESLRYSTHALLLGSTRGDVGQVVDALRVLALSLDEAGERQHAQQTLRIAVNLIEQTPIDDLDADARATYLATQHDVFEELTDLLLTDAPAITTASSASEQAWGAFAAAERGRVRSLQYAASQATSSDPLHVHAHSALQYQELFSRISSAAASTDTASGWSAAVGQLEKLSVGGQTSEPVSAVNLLPQLDRLGTTLVEFATGRNDLFAFVIDTGDIHVVRLGSRKRINDAAADLYQQLHDPEVADADIQRAARRLAQLALWPLTKYVRREHIIFIADDSLHTVPFAVLPWSQDSNSPLVLEHAESAVVPSALFMMQHRDAQRARGAAPRFELVGDPIFQSAAWRRDCSDGATAPAAGHSAALQPASDWTESLPPLPGSRTEVLAIAELARTSWPASHIGIHLGCKATPAALRDAAGTGTDILHVATHGYVDALRPRLSALALSRESATDSTDGAFSLLDILNVKASARLVVLSACDTSRGRLLPGEGVLGPAQAFLQSGASSVLASYWRIDDAATASFMRSFYKYLLAQRLPAAAALRRAQLEQSKSGSAHNWAGFALFGWPDEAL